MTSTSHPEFNDHTEGLEVARAFASGIHGKTVLVTGVNQGGLGFATAEAFASQSPGHVIITGRSSAKLETSIDGLKSQFPDVDYLSLVIDLSSQKSVRAAAAELLSWSNIPTIDIVVNNAGVMMIPERTIAEDGLELHFATNHIGHFLFANLIMPKIIKAAEKNPKGATRIINVSSRSPTFATMRWSDMNFETKSKDLPEAERPTYAVHQRWGVPDPENQAYLPLEGYNVSKVANVLFSIGLNANLYDKYGILSFSLHPGVIKTELDRYASDDVMAALREQLRNNVYAYKTLGAGASTSLVAALDPKLGVGETKDGKENYGVFLDDCQISHNAKALALSNSEAKKLWALSEKLVNEKFAW